jgi:hypothetical protein
MLLVSRPATLLSPGRVFPTLSVRLQAAAPSQARAQVAIR